MKKSSLGRRSSAAPPQRMTFSDLDNTRRERKSGIPVKCRSSSADRNMSLSTSKLVRSSSHTNLRVDSAYGNSVCSSGRLTVGGTERPSRALTMSSGLRMSSYGGSKSKRDNRLLKDKEWQMSAIREVEAVVRSIPEGRTMIEGGIKPITIKRFLDICNLLLSKLLNYDYELNMSNYLNEIPFILKLMLYRGKVDKSWLISANTPHAFPHVLGCLHFLASCYKAQTQVDPMSLMYPENFGANMDSAEDSWNFKELLPYFQESYSVYCAGAPDYLERQEELDKHVLQSHFGDKKILSDQIKSLEIENMKFEEMVNKKENENQLMKKDIDKLKAVCDGLHHEYDKQAENVSSIKDDIKRLENEIALLDCNEKSILASLEEKKIALKNLQESVDNQRVSRDDIKKIRENCATIERQLQSEALYIDEYENQIFQEDIVLMSLQNELQSKIREYTIMLNGFDEPSLENAKIPGNIQELDVENIEKASSCLREVQSKNVNVQKEITKKLQSYQILKEKYNADITKFESECDNKEEEINTIKEEINAQHAQHSKRLNELKIDLEAMEEKLLELKQQMPDNCEDLTDLIRRQKIIAEEMEAELQEYGRRTKLIISERMKMFQAYKVRMCKFLIDNGITLPEEFLKKANITLPQKEQREITV